MLFRSEGALHTSGKYNEPLIVGGTVFVGTDRIQAFGLRQPGQKAFVPASSPGKPKASVTVPPGKELFLSGGACAVCHGINGEGQVGVYPPLAGSEWVNGPEERLIRILLHGLQGSITASGKQYNAAAMPGMSSRRSRSGGICTVTTFSRKYRSSRNRPSSISALSVASTSCERPAVTCGSGDSAGNKKKKQNENGNQKP